MGTLGSEWGNHPKRPATWEFDSLVSIRQHLLHNAVSLPRPQGKLTMSMNANDAVRAELPCYLDGQMSRAVKRAA